MSIASINPATGETLHTFAPLTAAQLEEKLQRAADAYGAHRRLPFAERAKRMHRAAEILESGKERFGRMMTLEMGKTLRSAVEEAVKSAWGCRYYAENAERLLADEPVSTNARRSYIRYQPIGPVLAVMPWNFPFWQVFRFAAPALMAGNVGLLKHASNVPQCALAIEEIFREAGFAEGVFQTLLIGVEEVQQAIEDPRVCAVTLTGSERAGGHVAATAGRKIKKSVLELGGSDAFVVMPSADVEATARTAVRARTINNGQSCIAAKRFIVAEEIADRFEQRFVEEMRALRVGNPLEPSTDIGPLATPQIARELEDQVRRSVEAGARLLCGGRRLDRPGNFFEPAVLARIPKHAPAYHEELFGPVAALFRVRDLDEAIHLANDVAFGLGSSIWTNDPEEQARFTDEVEAGMAFVNGMVVSDPRLPFGGVKVSGYGRELSVYGIREFVNVKTVWIQDTAREDRAETE